MSRIREGRPSEVRERSRTHSVSEEKEEVVEKEARNRKKSGGIEGIEGEGKITQTTSNFQRPVLHKTLEEFKGDPDLRMTLEQRAGWKDRGRSNLTLRERTTFDSNL